MAAQLSARATIRGGASASASIGGATINTAATISKRQTIDPYTGDYTFTPTQYSQTIPILGKTAAMDIVINPIPSNYGLITWDGSTLTVS